MEIQSAFNAGVQGFQKANEDANKAAENIALSTGAAAESYSIDQNNSSTASNVNNTNGDSPANLTQSVVDLRVAEFQAKASAEVVKSADENLGTLLDVRV